MSLNDHYFFGSVVNEHDIDALIVAPIRSRSFKSFILIEAEEVYSEPRAESTISGDLASLRELVDGRQDVIECILRSH